MRKGLVQIYTGNGKGKTTAALGLALRASGAGLRVCILQFIKKRSYSEIKALRTVKNVKLEQCGRGCFIRGKPGAQDIECARQGLAKAEKAIRSRRFDVVILDEVNIALKLGLVNTYICQIESGNLNISLKVVERLAKALEVPVKILFEEDLLSLPLSAFERFPHEPEEMEKLKQEKERAREKLRRDLFKLRKALEVWGVDVKSETNFDN